VFARATRQRHVWEHSLIRCFTTVCTHLYTYLHTVLYVGSIHDDNVIYSSNYMLKARLIVVRLFAHQRLYRYQQTGKAECRTPRWTRPRPVNTYSLFLNWPFLQFLHAKPRDTWWSPFLSPTVSKYTCHITSLRQYKYEHLCILLRWEFLDWIFFSRFYFTLLGNNLWYNTRNCSEMWRQSQWIYYIYINLFA